MFSQTNDVYTISLLSQMLCQELRRARRMIGDDDIPNDSVFLATVMAIGVRVSGSRMGEQGAIDMARDLLDVYERTDRRRAEQRTQ